MRFVQLLTLVPLVAFAGWRPVTTLNGTVSDVVMLDAGVVLVTATAGNGLQVFNMNGDGGVTTQLTHGGNFIGGGLITPVCGFGMTNAGVLNFSGGCGTTRATTGVTMVGMRFHAVDQIVAIGGVGSSTNMYVFQLNATAYPNIGTWVSTPSQTVVRTADFGTTNFAVANASSTGEFRSSIDGGAVTSITSAALLTDLSPFSRAGLPALIGTASTGLVLHPDVRSTASMLTTFPSGETPRRVSMGNDQGMVITVSGKLASPVPDPANPSLLWKLRADQGITWGTRIDCLESRWCAAIDVTNQLWLYENASSPLVQIAPVIADAGVTVRLTVDAGDPDFDPLFHAWDGGAGITIIPATGFDDGAAVDVTVPAGFCGVLEVSVTSTDGLHTITTPVSLRTPEVGRGEVNVSLPTTPPIAGGAAVAFGVALDGGCDQATFSWATSDGQSGSGPAFSYQPPVTLCGAPASVTVTATWASGVPATTTTMVNTSTIPWGIPETPVFPNPASQRSGTSQFWSTTDLQHACVSAGGFPGTQLLWDTIDAGQGTATLLDGGLLLTFPSLCAPTQFAASARREVIGEQNARISPAGTLVVDVAADFAPLDSTVNYALTAQADGGVVFGSTLVTASCLTERGLESEISVVDGVTTVVSSRFATPGVFSLAVPGGCSGGAREVVARLFEDGGDTGAEQRIPIVLPIVPVAIGPASAQLTARCGEGVRGQITLEPVAGACAAVETSWRQTSGPSLTITSGAGSIADVSSVATDFSMAGESITFEWAVDAGGGNALAEERAVEIGVDPFVEIAARTLPLIRREESVFDLEITLTNTTTCAVDGLEVRMPLSASTPIASTLLLDGVRRDAVIDTDGSLVLTDVSLGASSTRIVKLSARPKLLGTPGVEPRVLLHGLLVSIAPTIPEAPTGCGCTSSSSMAFVLLSLLALARRRSSR